MRTNIAIVVLVVVVLAAVLGLLPSAASGSLSNRTFTPTGGTIYYTGRFKDEPKDEPATSILTVYWGEQIVFRHAVNGSVAVVVTGPYTKSGEKYSGEPFKKASIDAGEIWDSEGWPTEGYFEVKDQYGEGGWFEMIKHSFAVEVVGKREKVQEEKSFSLRLRENEKEGGVLKLSIEDEEGYSITNRAGADIYEVPLAYNNTGFAAFADAPVGGIAVAVDQTLLVETAELGMEMGEYTIILEDAATEAEATAEIEVEERYLNVACDDEVVKGDEIVVIIESSFYEEEATITLPSLPEGEGTLTVVLDDEGKKKVRIPSESLEYGTQRITVTVGELEETAYATITKSAVCLTVPDNATVGDIVPIQGRSDAGEVAVIVIDDTVNAVVQITAERFKWDWDTTGEFDGYRILEVFILAAESSIASGEQVSEAWRKEHGVDAAASIVLLAPTFSMAAPSSIAEGDEVVITGSATGTDQVYLLVMDDRGEVVFPPARSAQATPVEAGQWEERIPDLETGSYLALALHQGRDGSTAVIWDGEWTAGGAGKTLTQRRELLVYVLTAPGSDDLFEFASFRVSSPYVRLTVPELWERGEELIVTAETNVKEGERAFVSLLIGPRAVITPVSTLVENGSILARMNTSELQPGLYTVRVEIGGRASDEAKLRFVTPREQEEEEAQPQYEPAAEPGSGVGPELAENADQENGGAANESQEHERALKIPVNDVLLALIAAVVVAWRAKRGSR